METRRQVMIGMTSLAALGHGSPAAAQSEVAKWPVRPVKIIVGYTPGGGIDVAARLTADAISRTIGQQFVVENLAGASGTIAAGSVIKSPPDGSVILMGALAEMAVAPRIMSSATYDTLRDLEPCVAIGISPLVLIASDRVPANNLQELLALAKARPGMLQFGSAGAGTTSHLAAELLKIQAGIDLVAVPYRGSSTATTDVLAGHIDMVFEAIPSAAALVREKKVKAIAVATTRRSSQLPEVPTFEELGIPGVVAGSWFGFFVPVGTPAEITGRLAKEVNAALVGPLGKSLSDRGFEPISLGAGDFRQYVAGEIKKWAEVVTKAGLKQN